MDRPLEGIRVIELANYVAAPIVGRFLADLGAEVIKIEGRGGDAWRNTAAEHTGTDWEENPMFDVFNAGKKSLSLNLKTEIGREIFFRLLEKADLLLTNTRQKSLVKLGVDYDSLKDRFPRLIYATLTGYGYEGPDCNAPGFDNIAFWSRSGYSADMMIEGPGSYPVNSRFAMGDTISGTMLFGAVMTALYKRERTGRGDFVTMSLYNAGIWAFCGGVVLAQAPYCQPMPETRCMGKPSNLAYRCADGEWIRCTFFEFDRYADKFFGALDLKEEVAEMGIDSMEATIRHADVLVPMLEERFSRKTSDEWVKIFTEMDIVCGRLNHFKDVLTDEQAWANDYLQEYTCSNGAKRVLPSIPVRLGEGGAFPIGKAVRYGADNTALLEKLGYSSGEIAAIAESGALES